MVIKAINDTADLNALILTFFISDAYFCIIIDLSPSLS